MYEENVIHDKEGKKSIFFFASPKSFGMSNYSTLYVWCYILPLNFRGDILKRNFDQSLQKPHILKF